MAPYADITANATCGVRASEVYCKLDDDNDDVSSQTCGICDAVDGPAHPVAHVVDSDAGPGAGTWWQSPTLQLGQQNHFVTITVDLKNVRVFLIILRDINSSPEIGVSKFLKMLECF